MDKDPQEQDEIRVVDRRRFTAEGEGKVADGPKQAAPVQPQEAAKEQATKREEPTKKPGPQRPAVDFASFIVSLAHQTMVMLGEVPHPETKQVVINLEAARQTIDIIELLEQKTVGNLTEDEQKLIGDILASVRIAYVDTVRQSK